MKFQTPLPVVFAFLLSSIAPAADPSGYSLANAAVKVPPSAPALVHRAADEIRSYQKQLTGRWPGADAAVRIELRTGSGGKVPSGGPDASQNFALYEEGGRQIVHGASPVATLWAAYELIESWGVGFYFGGDQLPAVDPERRAKFVTVTRQPALAIRGTLPWCNFANSPTSWNPQDYRTFLEQLSRQKANFIGFRAYDEEPFAAWFPTPETHEKGLPLMMATNDFQRTWSPPPWGAWRSLFGTDLFFDRDDWGSDLGRGEASATRAIRAQQQAMIDAVAYARQGLGMKTCMGFEVTGDPADPNQVENVTRRLRHVLDVYDLDYVWIWQPEAKAVHHKDRKPESDLPQDFRKTFDYLDRNAHDLHEARRMLAWLEIAHRTIKEHKPSVTMVASGWGGEFYLKFSDYYPGLDKVLPEDVVFSALDYIDPWHHDLQPEWSKEAYAKSEKKTDSSFSVKPGDFISAAYGQLAPGRVRWPIVWFESDGYRNADQTMPQPNVLAFEPVLKDVVAKGCQGVLGIQWRTRNVRDVAAYTLRFAWNPSLTAKEFFKDYARDHYGPALAEPLTAIHLRLEEMGSTYAGHSATWECGKKFHWFQPDRGEPQPLMFAELDAIEAKLVDLANSNAASDRQGAKRELLDLANTLRWVTAGGRTGMEIFEKSGKFPGGPLLARLEKAEAQAKEGDTADAAKEAHAVAADLVKLPFREALPALATTVRTRGELGMLLTANQRYGRYYTEFVERLRKLADAPGLVPLETPWTYAETANVFPVPASVPTGIPIDFDAVTLRRDGSIPPLEVELSPASGAPGIRQPLRPIGGAYQRARVSPPSSGLWSWRIVSPGDSEAIASGVCRVDSTYP